MSKTILKINDNRKSLTFEREFSVTKDKLWEAYSSANMLDRWFAPKGWDCITKQHSFKDGGRWVYTLKCIDPKQTDFYGMEMPGMLTYDSINPKDSFGYTDTFLNEQGEIDSTMPSSHTVLTLRPKGTGTQLSFTTSYQSVEALQQVIEMGMQQGLEESHDKLEELVKSL
jgi:uncharacterized protein YndB with AHSA1/START domain